jgi:nucleotide-binding universal stress UspA family protein
MLLKDILLLAGPNSTAARAYALSVASSFNAHLTAAGLVLDLSSPNSREMLSYDIFVSMTESRRAALLVELERFAREARLNDVYTEVEIMTAAIGMAWQTVGEFARRFDLTIVQQSDTNAKREQDLEIEAALFGSGRPIIVVPYIHKSPLQLDSVLIAWDGSSVAARAVGDAMLLLIKAGEVHIVTVARTPDEQIETSGAQIARHLARHDVNAEFKILPSGVDVANTLLSYAADEGANFMVMGAYGHSRYRELLLGGTTRAILRAMTLPVFMSH